MKRTKKAVYFFSGMLASLLLINMITPALATGLSKYIEVFTGVSIYVDDAKLNPRDANGNPVDVFIYNGTTYLPVRAVSEALGIPVQWDGSTRSVYVGKHIGDKPAAWLTDMDYFSGTSDREFHTADSQKDNLGETHYHCITGNLDRTYQLNGQYSKFSGTIYQTYQSRSNSGTVELAVYGDGELIYHLRNEGITGMKPVEFEVDLTGVLELRVYFFNRRYAGIMDYSDIFALGDVGLWA